MTRNDPKPPKSFISLQMLNEFPEEVKRLRELGKRDDEIDEILGVLSVGKNPRRKTIIKEYPFSWWCIDDFIDALDRIAKLESLAEKIQKIKETFKDKFGREMTVGGIVKALEADLKERKSDTGSADWERLRAIKELLFIYFRHAYDPHPIFLWRAYTLCRQIQLPLPPELLRYLDGVADRIGGIIDQKVNTTHPYKYAITGEIPKRGKPDPQQGARKLLRRWEAYFHPSDDHYYKGNNGEVYSDRTIQLDAEEMRKFAECKLSQMLRRPNQFLL